MPIELVCACGRKLLVANEHVGRRVCCPGCKAVLQVPGELSALESPSEPRHRDLAWLLLGLLVPLALAGFLLWWFWGKLDLTGTPPDLALVPPDAQGFGSIRVAELWESAPVSKALAEQRRTNPAAADLSDQLEAETGFRPEQIERLTGVLLDLDSNLAYAVILTRGAYDLQALLNRLRPVAGGPVMGLERQHQSDRYYLGIDNRGNELALYPVSSRVLVVGSEASVRQCIYLRTGPTPTPGPLSPVLARCESEKLPGLIGLNVSQSLRERLLKIPGLSVLAPMHQATGIFQFKSDKAHLEIRGQLPDNEQAKKLHEELSPLLRQAKGLLALGAIFQQGPQGKAMSELGKLLNKAKTRQEGNAVILEIETEAESAARQLLQGAAAIPGR
jgi:hypothetical protein